MIELIALVLTLAWIATVILAVWRPTTRRIRIAVIATAIYLFICSYPDFAATVRSMV